MPNARRLVALPAALLLAAGLGIVPAGAGTGPAVIDAHDSHIPAAAYEISSSSGGTVYSADIGGFGRVFLAPTAMAVGSPTIDLGPRPYHRMGATISGTRVAMPYYPTFSASSYSAPVTTVRSCPIGTCPTMSTLTVPAGYVYVGNAGDQAVVWSSAQNRVGLSTWAGVLGTTWVLPVPYDEPPRVVADTNGIALSGGGNVTFVNRAANTVTDLDYGDGATLTTSYIVWHAVGVGPEAGPWTTKIYRALRSSAGIVGTVADLADSPGIEELAATETGVAWTTPNGAEDGSKALWSMPYDGTPALYARRLISSGLSNFEATSQFLVNDRLAGVPGFYKVAPGAYSGSLTGILPVRPSITRSLAVSTGRAAYTDDTTVDHPAYYRDVTNGAPGPESSLTHSAESVGLSGPYVAFTRHSATAGSMEVHYGRLGSTLTVRTYPASEVGKVEVSGHRVLVTGGARSRVIDIVTGSVLDLGAVFPALFGDSLATINQATGLVQLRNLTDPGFVRTVRAAACTSSCVDDDGWHLSVWGAEVVYAFYYGGASPGFATGHYNGLTSATTALPMLVHAGDPDVWELEYWDGLLLVSHAHDVAVRLHDLRAGGSGVVVDTFSEGPLGIDGNVVAWRPNSDLRAVVRDVRDFVPGFTPEARVIGGRYPLGFGPGAPVPTWKPSIQLSQEMTATLEIRSGSATGPVVRSIPVSSAEGELTPTWDGKDGSGVQLPQGTYHWTLAGATAPVKNARGSAPATGSVYLSTAPLGGLTVNAPTLSTDISGTATFPVSWNLAGAPAGTKYNVSRSVNGGAYTTWITGTASNYANMTGAAGATYRFRATAVDPSGRTGTAGAVDTTVVPYDDRATGTVYAGSWPTASNSGLYLGSHHYSSAAGATYSFKATGTTIHLIGTKGTSYGRFQVSIDGGAYGPLIDSYRAGTAFRQVLYTKTGLTNAPHTIKVKVQGTAGRPNVSIDGVGFLR